MCKLKLLTTEEMATMTEDQLSEHHTNIERYLNSILEARGNARMANTTVLSELVKTQTKMSIKTFSDALNAEIHCRHEEITYILTQSRPNSPLAARSLEYMKRIGFHFMVNSIKEPFRIFICIRGGETMIFETSDSGDAIYDLNVVRVETKVHKEKADARFISIQ